MKFWNGYQWRDTNAEEMQLEKHIGSNVGRVILCESVDEVLAIIGHQPDQEMLEKLGESLTTNTPTVETKAPGETEWTREALLEAKVADLEVVTEPRTITQEEISVEINTEEPSED